jgi:hypothetical protein
VSFTLILIHLGVGAVWLGGMLYSLFVVQPRVPRVLPDPVAAEELYREFGAGNRWRVIGLIAVLALSGVGLIFVASGHSSGGGLTVPVDSPTAPRGALAVANGPVTVAGGHSGLWWAAIEAKVVLLAGASVLFWWVSWRGWPRRVFALPREIPAEQARFRRVALAMAGLVGVAFVLGVTATHLLH